MKHRSSGALALLLVLLSSGTGTAHATAARADPRSDAPEAVVAPARPAPAAATYAEALQRWRGADDVNAWIAANFRYDMPRALQLSETQRNQGMRLPIHAPEAFYAKADGVCVDLARFAVETLARIAPEAKPQYLMIEFDPVTLAGQTLRRHWLVSFERDGRRWFFADSKRPGHVAGPYADTAAFIADYAAYRQRGIVAFQERDSFERRARRLAQRQERETRAIHESGETRDAGEPR